LIQESNVIISISRNNFTIMDNKSTSLICPTPINKKSLIHFNYVINKMCFETKNIKIHTKFNKLEIVGMTIPISCDNYNLLNYLNTLLKFILFDMKNKIDVNNYNNFYINKFNTISRCFKLFRYITIEFKTIGNQYEKYISFTNDIINKWENENYNHMPNVTSSEVLIPLCAMIMIYNKNNYKIRLRNIFKKVVDTNTLSEFIEHNLVDLDITNEKFGGDFKTEFICSCLKSEED